MGSYDAATQAQGAQAFHREEIAGFRAACIGRAGALSVVALLTAVLAPWPGPLYYHALIGLFILLGYIEYRVAKASWGRPIHQYLLTALDFALLAFTLIYPNPLSPLDVPPQAALWFGNFIYFFTLLAGLAYVYSPRLVLWGGIAGALAWSAGIGWILSQPDMVWRPPASREEALVALATNPNFIDLNVRVQEVTVLVICAGLIALAVGRARRIALRQAALAQQRANLARYFPPHTAELLAASPHPFALPRERDVAVLFADLVGFTHWCEGRSPQQVIAYLRDVHEALAGIVFRHGGTLEKFTGDGVFATFGTPEPSDADAANAIGAAIEMVDRFAAATATTDGGSEPPPSLSVGVHFGPVVLGDIGTAQRMEFATLGNTVNIASRLEEATRTHGCRALLSRALIEAADRHPPASPPPWHPRLTSRGPITIRGLSDAMHVFAVQAGP